MFSSPICLIQMMSYSVVFCCSLCCTLFCSFLSCCIGMHWLHCTVLSDVFDQASPMLGFEPWAVSLATTSPRALTPSWPLETSHFIVWDMLTRHSNNLVTYWSQNDKRMYHIVYRVLLNVFLLDIGHTRSYESLACATAYQSYQSSRCRFYSKIRMKKGLGAGPLSKYAWWLRLVFKRLRTPSLTMRFCWKAWA